MYPLVEELFLSRGSPECSGGLIESGIPQFFAGVLYTVSFVNSRPTLYPNACPEISRETSPAQHW